MKIITLVKSRKNFYWLFLISIIILILVMFFYVFSVKSKNDYSLAQTFAVKNSKSNFSNSNDPNSAGIKAYGTNNTGMINTYVDPVVLQKLYRVNWQKNKYSKPMLKKHGKSCSNNYGLNYWIDTTLPDKSGGDNNNNRIVTQLPNSGDVIFSRDTFGTDMLRSTLWKKPLSSDPNKNAADDYFKITNKLANLNAHRSFLHFGIDFGLPIALVADDKNNSVPVDANANNKSTSTDDDISSRLWFGGKNENLEDENSKPGVSNDTFDVYNNQSSETFDSHNIFSTLLNSSSSKNSFTSMPKITNVITTNDLQFTSVKSNLYDYLHSARAIRPPFNSYKLKLFNVDPSLVTQSSEFMIGTFGIELNDFSSNSSTSKPLYLTFTFQNDLNNSITNVDGNSTDKQGTNSEHLIIDVNADSQSQLNEIGDIYSNLQTNTNYSNAHKLAFLNALDGHTSESQNISAGYKWDIQGRESFSLVENNSFGEPAVINKQSGNIITSDRYNKNDPGRNINTGFHPEKFSNFVLQQIWPRKDMSIDYSKPSLVNSIYCTKNRYKFFDGYQRDRTVKTTNPQTYTSPNYATYDSMSLYESSFYFDTKYIKKNHYWKLGSYHSSSQYYFFAQVNPRPVSDDKYKTTIPMLAHFGSGVNKKKIPLIWNSNLHFETGGIVALSIVFVIIVGSLIFLRPWRKISILSTKNIDKYLEKAEKIGKKTIKPKLALTKKPVIQEIQK